MILPSPNIWRWPDVYEIENGAQDAHDAIWTVVAEVAPWTGRDVVDVGCGSGFHLPRFAMGARSVVGIEPHARLVARAAARIERHAHVRVLPGTGEVLPLPADSADVVHARTACFFGPGCEPALAEAQRVLRPGGVLVIVDLDATRSSYGRWMRRDVPSYDPGAAERFFDRLGFALCRVDTMWSFRCRSDLVRVLDIEFSAPVARLASAATAGTTLDVAYRVHWRRNEARIHHPR